MHCAAHLTRYKQLQVVSPSDHHSGGLECGHCSFMLQCCSAGPIFKVIFNICCVREVQGVCIGTYCTIIVSIFFTATNPASECGHVTQGCMLGRAEKELLRRFHNHGEGPYTYKDLLCQPNLVVPYYL